MLAGIGWIGSLFSTALATWLPALSLYVIGLCLSGPIRGQERFFLDGAAPPFNDQALADDSLRVASVPPRENAIFAPPPYDDGTRYLPDGNGWIVVSDPMAYPRVPALDCDDPDRLLYTYRPNLFGIDVPDEWDFYNLINTDRPDFTDATYSVGQGVTIIETGYTYRRAFDHPANSEQSRRSIPEALLRYGLTNEFELRLKWNGYVMKRPAQFQYRREDAALWHG